MNESKTNEFSELPLGLSDCHMSRDGKYFNGKVITISHPTLTRSDIGNVQIAIVLAPRTFDQIIDSAKSFETRRIHRIRGAIARWMINAGIRLAGLPRPLIGNLIDGNWETRIIQNETNIPSSTIMQIVESTIHSYYTHHFQSGLAATTISMAETVRVEITDHLVDALFEKENGPVKVFVTPAYPNT